MRPKNLVNICQKEYFFTINFVRAKYNKAIFILQWRNFSRVSKVLQYRDGFALLHSRMEWGKLPFSPSITSKAKTGMCRSIWSFNILPAGDSRVFHCRPCPGVGNFNRPGWVEKFEPVEYTRSLKVESPLSWENALEENFHIVEWHLREENQWAATQTLLDSTKSNDHTKTFRYAWVGHLNTFFARGTPIWMSQLSKVQMPGGDVEDWNLSMH